MHCLVDFLVEGITIVANIMSVTYETSRGNGEMVCWVPLVDRLEITQSKLKSFYPVMEGSHNTLLQSTGPPLESRDTQIQFQDVQLSSHRPQFSMQGIGASSTRSRLHTAESSREIPLCATATVPGIQICRRSWDFMVSYYRIEYYYRPTQCYHSLPTWFALSVCLLFQTL
jgi:hypothetical protein